MRPMTMTRARFAAGATAVGATLAVVPATASTGTPAQAAAAPVTAASAPALPQAERQRKRTPTVTVRHVRRNVIAGRTAAVTGTLQPGLKGHVVRLQTRTAHGWQTVDRTLTRAHGAYRLRYRPQAPGTATLRVLFPGDKTAKPAQHKAGRVNAFRRAVASWYGLYGSALACGGTLGYDELGVAHKTLPCGTRLTLRYHGRSVRVRVIDRGPYVGGRDFDLTGATKRALGFGDVGTVLATR